MAEEETMPPVLDETLSHANFILVEQYRKDIGMYMEDLKNGGRPSLPVLQAAVGGVVVKPSEQDKKAHVFTDIVGCPSEDYLAQVGNDGVPFTLQEDKLLAGIANDANNSISMKSLMDQIKEVFKLPVSITEFRHAEPDVVFGQCQKNYHNSGFHLGPKKDPSVDGSSRKEIARM